MRLRECEVMDIDEEAFRENRVSAHLYGYMSVPYARGLTQSAKAGGVAGEERALNDIATEVVAGMEPDALYILGPGTTTRTVMERLGLPKTLLGVDAVRDGALAGADLTEGELLELAAAAPRAYIVVTVIGGQGHVFGRGNQQISPAVIRARGPRRRHRDRHADQAAQPGGPAAARRHGRPRPRRAALRLRQGRHGARRAHDVQGRA